MIQNPSPFFRAASVSGLAAATSLMLGGCSMLRDEPAYVSPPEAETEDAQVMPVVQGAAMGQQPAGPATATATIDPDDQIVQHTVVTGDSLWKLSRDYKTTIAKIKVANQLEGDTIIAGQTLNIPTKNPPAGAVIATPAPAATPAAPVATPATPAPTPPAAVPPAQTPPTQSPAPSASPSPSPTFTPYPQGTAPGGETGGLQIQDQ